MDPETKQALTAELLIGLNIYEITVIQNSQVCFSDLVTLLKPDLTRHQINLTIDRMFDMRMIYGEWEICKKEGGWMRCLYLSRIFKDYFAQIYSKIKPLSPSASQTSDDPIVPIAHCGRI
jgi:hypothetical protein